MGSGFLFALTTVSEELLIKRNLGIIDFLAMLGFSGTAVSSIQLLVLVCLLVAGLSLHEPTYVFCSIKGVKLYTLHNKIGFIKTHGSELWGQEEAGLRDEPVSYLQVAPL